jgi:hypothetical protein
MNYFIGFVFGLIAGAIPFAILWMQAEKSVFFWRNRYFEQDAWYAFSKEITPEQKD